MLSKKNLFSQLFFFTAIINLVVLLFFFSFLKNGFWQEKKPADFSAAAQKEIIADPFITRGEAAEEFLLEPILDGADPVLGPEKAAITIVEFSDFSCKFCAKQDEIVREALKKYPDKIKLIWKDYPNAASAGYLESLAGRCAFAQNKFWEYHNLLFAASSSLESGRLAEMAEEAGLDAIEFSACLKNEKFAKAVQKNISEGDALRLPGTPFFFINRQEILGEINPADLEKIIEIELEK